MQKFTTKVKKVLDKVEDQWYNIINDGRALSIPPLSSVIDTHSFDVDRSRQTKETLLEYSAIINSDAVKNYMLVKEYFEGLNPTFAGGCIRDMVFGIPPKDWDLFVNVDHITDPADREDFIALYVAALREALPSDPDRYPEMGGDAASFEKTPPEEREDRGIVEVWTIHFPQGERRGFWGFRDTTPPLQVIFIDGPTKPVDITSKFDYNMVEGAFDTSDPNSGVYLSEDFHKGLLYNEFIPKQKGASSRFTDWIFLKQELLAKFYTTKNKKRMDV